jgi:hypothetical protein
MKSIYKQLFNKLEQHFIFDVELYYKTASSDVQHIMDENLIWKLNKMDRLKNIIKRNISKMNRRYKI